MLSQRKYGNRIKEIEGTNFLFKNTILKDLIHLEKYGLIFNRYASTWMWIYMYLINMPAFSVIDETDKM